MIKKVKPGVNPGNVTASCGLKVDERVKSIWERVTLPNKRKVSYTNVRAFNKSYEDLLKDVVGNDGDVVVNVQYDELNKIKGFPAFGFIKFDDSYRVIELEKGASALQIMGRENIKTFIIGTPKTVFQLLNVKMISIKDNVVSRYHFNKITLKNKGDYAFIKAFGRGQFKTFKDFFFKGLKSEELDFIKNHSPRMFNKRVKLSYTQRLEEAEELLLTLKRLKKEAGAYSSAFGASNTSQIKARIELNTFRRVYKSQIKAAKALINESHNYNKLWESMDTLEDYLKNTGDNVPMCSRVLFIETSITKGVLMDYALKGDLAPELERFMAKDAPRGRRNLKSNS